VVGCPFGTNLEYLNEDYGMVYSGNNSGIRVFIDPNSMKQWDPVGDALWAIRQEKVKREM
jgi:hypothetical protein